MTIKLYIDAGAFLFKALLSKEFVSGGSIVVGVLIAFTEFMKWSGLLNYFLAFIVLIFGFLWSLKK